MDIRNLIVIRSWLFFYKESKKNGMYIVLIVSWGGTI